MKRHLIWVVLVGLGIVGTVLAEEPARPRKEPLNLPPAWQAVGAQERLAAKRVAEVDALRLLTERIYGIRINADTLVLDLALASDEIRGDLSQMMKGVRTTGEKYTDDFTVEVTRQVTLREVVETITRTLRRTQRWYGVKEEELTDIDRTTRDTVLAVVGNGAVPGSKGQRMIQAKRAAEMDGFRKLVEIIVGTQITSDTRVRDLVLASDKIATHVAAVLKGAKTTDIVYRDDGSCEVTKQIVLREVIETVMRSYQRYVQGGKVTENEFRKVMTEVRDKVVTATGTGAPRAEGMETVGPASMEPFYEEVQIIQRVVKREVGVIE
ncbi:MAG TPA: hypothetical protein VNA25_26170 [Phycisphaerae bacterium]|nr:hypothetical protein [Phycisphaerae bacterium]